MVLRWSRIQRNRSISRSEILRPRTNFVFIPLFLASVRLLFLGIFFDFRLCVTARQPYNAENWLKGFGFITP